jgi:hypothetical protein
LKNEPFWVIEDFYDGADFSRLDFLSRGLDGLFVRANMLSKNIFARVCGPVSTSCISGNQSCETFTGSQNQHPTSLQGVLIRGQLTSIGTKGGGSLAGASLPVSEPKVAVVLPSGSRNFHHLGLQLSSKSAENFVAEKENQKSNPIL